MQANLTQPTQPTLPPPQNLAGFNVDHAVERMLGRPALWWEAVGIFVHHFAEWEAEWLSKQGNNEAERRCVHALRSSAANVGADHLSCIAATLEELLAKRCSGQNVAIPPSIRWYLKDCFRETWRSAAAAKQLTMTVHS
jgi:HPt (histidine-containing phosphotransfer) domain-containing protein